jgi:phenylalanyl-tRNA synthetase beta chain
MHAKEQKKGAPKGEDASEGLSDEILYKLDIPANRYDLLCLEGVVHALRVFREKTEPANFQVVAPAQKHVLTVKKETKQVRPVVVAAVLRDLSFDQVSYDSFIELQDKLHQNICRKRQLVSVGTHDLDTIQGPFSYEARAPKDIKFVPLNQTKEMDADELFAFYDEHDRNLKKFLHIIRDSPVYPVIYDANRTVLSLPPIINSDHSKITLDTTNVLIEVTAVDHTKAKIVLNTVVAMFSQYCKRKFTVEPVSVEAEEPGNGQNGTSNHGVYPDLSPVEFQCDVEYLNSGCGLSLSAEEQVGYLRRMSLLATPNANPNAKGESESESKSESESLTVLAPITRSDVLHPCDVQEDLAIAYGYDNLRREFPKTLSYGKQQPLNKLTDLLRREVSLCGFDEVLTLSLCQRDDIFAHLRIKEDFPDGAVFISNPQTLEFQVARTTMLPGLLKTCHHNRDMPLPLRIFEISDVVLRDDARDTGARNERRLCALYSSKTSGLEHIHGLLDRVMDMQRVQWEGDASSEKQKKKNTYRIEEARDNPTFLPDRCARVLYNDRPVGYMGILHPEVLQAFRVSFPTAALEINLEPFL